MGKTHNQVVDGFIADDDGYGPYAIGGQVNAKAGVVTFEDTAAKALFTLPAGARIIAWQVNIPTAFDAGSSNLLDIGKAGAAAAYANDLDVSATGQIAIGFVPGALFTELAEETTVTATFIPTGTAATAGSATVNVLYILL